MAENSQPLSPAWRRAVWPILAFGLLNLGASLCFKEGGTDAAHRWQYFIGGNMFGISSTWFLMQAFRCLNVNVVSLLTAAVGFVSVQTLFWLLYRPALQPLQGLGFALIFLGTPLVAWGRARPSAEARP